MEHHVSHVMMVSIDTLRYDCIGYQPDKYWLDTYRVRKELKTETLDKIASRSVCYTHCFSTSSYTTNSHASLFTGLFPPKHGVRQFFKSRVRGDADTLAAIFKRHGYRTVMMSDNPVLFQHTGLDAGFDSMYTDELAAIGDIKMRGPSRVFSFFHFFDVHDPYLFSHNPVSGSHNEVYFEFLERECRRHDIAFRREDHQRSYYELFYKMNGDVDFYFPLYVRGVSVFDAGRLRRFVDAIARELNFFDHGILVLFSDHGEGRIDDIDQKKFRHGGLLYDDVLRVPLLVYHPDMRAEVRGDLISLVDLFPTVLDLARIPAGSHRSGCELDGRVRGGEREWTYAEYWARQGKHLFSSFGGENLLRQRVVRTKDRKYLLNGTPEAVLDAKIGERKDDELLRLIERGIYMSFGDERSHEERAARDLGSLSTWAGVIDIKDDPRELKVQSPVDRGDPVSTAACARAFGKIYSLESEAVVTEEISLGKKVSERIEEVVKNAANKKVILYGAGEHTTQLFRETAIGKAAIVAIVDSDKTKWGTAVNGIPVISPDDGARRKCDMVVISSYSFQEEIYTYLSGHPEWSTREIIKLYESPERGDAHGDPVARQLKNLGYF